jgi:hypothetical protein
VDFPESDLLQFFYRYQRFFHTGSATVSIRKRGRRTANLHQGFRSSVDYNTAVRVTRRNVSMTLEHLVS